MPISEPYVLAEDEQIILAYNQALREKYREDREIHLEVFPEPYAGNPQASIILLNLNPGYYPRNKVFGQGTADFRRMWRANLAHEPRTTRFIILIQGCKAPLVMCTGVPSSRSLLTSLE